MNILLSFSSEDGPTYLAFNTDSLNLELEHHKNILDAIDFSREELKKELSQRVKNKSFGDSISVIWGEITNDCYIIESSLRGEAQFSDEECEEYDPRYTNITIEPPFHIDEVYIVRTFV